MQNRWTAFYCDLSHCGKPGDARWATVQRFSDGADLLKWYRGCGFSPDTERHASVDAAKAAGERWIGGPSATLLCDPAYTLGEGR